MQPAEPTLQELKKELKTISANWKNLGVHLGLPMPTLDKVEKDNTGVDDRLNDMLHKWLQSNAKGTWKNIVTALRIMEENRVADCIERTYCSDGVGALVHVAATGKLCFTLYCMVLKLIFRLISGEQERYLDQRLNGKKYLT